MKNQISCTHAYAVMKNFQGFLMYRNSLIMCMDHVIIESIFSVMNYKCSAYDFHVVYCNSTPCRFLSALDQLGASVACQSFDHGGGSQASGEGSVKMAPNGRFSHGWWPGNCRYVITAVVYRTIAANGWICYSCSYRSMLAQPELHGSARNCDAAKSFNSILSF